MCNSARFRSGDRVEVVDLAKPGHVRIPYYIRQQVGRIVQHCGIYLNPEHLSVGITSGPAVNLYRVAFDQQQLWPDEGHGNNDKLIIEIYEHWLKPSPEDENTGTKDR